MSINWYPGHMAKSMRIIREQATEADCFVYVLDSRAPLASQNGEFLKIARGKPILYVLNKADLVEYADLERWLIYFSERGLVALTSDSVSCKNKTEVISKLKQLNEEKIQRYAERGVKKSIRAMVIGVPNSGKSTFINSLVGSKKAITGNKPGVTRGKQWVSIFKGLDLLDTPGTLPPNLADQKVAVTLAIIGSINDDIVDMTELALEIAKFYETNCAELFCNRFKIDRIVLEDAKVLEDVARSRGYLLSGGVIDIERASRAVVDDFRRGHLGRVALERP